jgi:hypothetical protein
MSVGTKNKFSLVTAAESTFATPLALQGESLSALLVFTGGTQVTAPVAYAVIGPTGNILRVIVVSGGVYSVAPTGVTAPAGGTSATFTVQTTGVSPNILISAVNVTAAGSGYTVASAANAKFFPVRMDRPVVNIETATDEDTLTGVYESGLNSIVTKQTVSASVEMDARLDAIALFGKFALGNLSTGSPVGGVYPHTITVGTADAPSATAYFQDAFCSSIQAHQYAGVKVQSLTIRGDAGGKITMSAELMGSGIHTLAVANTLSTTMPIASTEGILGASRVSAFTLGGVNLKTVLKSFEFVFENVFDDAAEMVAGAKTLPAMERIGFNISGSFTFKADTAASAKDLIDSIIGNSRDQSISNAIVLTITGVDALAAHSCTINVYNAIIDNTAITGQRAKLEKPIGFKGLYSVTDSKACQILVNNATVSYAS